MRGSAGLLLYKDVENKKKILLVHPTSAAWTNTFAIPKGEVSINDANLMETAIRETYEEVGIKIRHSDINSTLHYIDYKNSDKKVYKRVYFYVVNATHYNLPDILPETQLQLEEVDYAKFYDYEEGKGVIFWRYENIFDLV